MFDLAHIAMVVKDAEKSAQFYNQVLDFAIRKQSVTPVFKVVFLKAGALVIELLEYLQPETEPRSRGVIDHLAFRVKDLPAVMATLEAKGVKFETAQPRQAFDGSKIAFFHGPDGERIELVEF
ncbi:MAG: VOC family protein [Syntrophomonadaceae bacterium]